MGPAPSQDFPTLSKPGEGGPQAGCGWEPGAKIDWIVEKIQLNRTYPIHPTTQISQFSNHTRPLRWAPLYNKVKSIS